MFSRQITMQINKNWTPEFPKVIEKEVLPLLRRQKGFLDELILLAPDKTEVVAISLWENKEFAETYNREFYPEVVKIINKYVEGLPVVKTFEVEYATLQRSRNSSRYQPTRSRRRLLERGQDTSPLQRTLPHGEHRRKP